MFRSRSKRRPTPATAPSPGVLPPCPSCESTFLCPMDWETAGPGHWRMWLRCGECEAWIETILDNRRAAALDVELDRQVAEIAAGIRALDSERLASLADAFAGALRRDLICANDFARGDSRRERP